MELKIYEFSSNAKDQDLGSIDRRVAFIIRTCQRTIILSKTDLPAMNTRRSFEGSNAYDFLLRFACGLESEIKGETDVFGQIKTAYKELQIENPSLATHFQSIFLKLFEDTKEIRAEFLHGIGGNNYGTLARRLLNPKTDERVLILGAGQISKSVAPYFADSKLTIFNRSETRLLELKTELAQKGYSKIVFTQDEKTLLPAMIAADLIIICTPAHSDLDQKVIDVAIEKNSKVRILHLGAQAPDMDQFDTRPNLKNRVSSLSELFAMETEQNFFREKQVSLATEACRHRAILRSMARSASLAHGWEDLALFY